MVQILNSRSENAGAERAHRRMEARRLEILRAAGRTFRRLGFAASGMREIAAEADLSPGNLYHYFKGKHEILYFCQDRTLSNMLAALTTARASEAPVADQLRQVLTAHIRFILDEMDGSAAHLELESLPPDLLSPIVGKRDRYERGIRRLVAAGMRSGEFQDADATIVTRAILGALNWTARWFRPDGRQSATAVATRLVDYLMSGLLGAPATARPDTQPAPPSAEPSPGDS